MRDPLFFLCGTWKISQCRTEFRELHFTFRTSMTDRMPSEESDGDAQICPIKREFLSLQERMELAKTNLDNDENLDFQKKAVKLNILKEAKILSGEILEAHDKNADCICFLRHLTSGNKGCYETDNAAMLSHLETLKKLLSQLDQQTVDTGSQTETGFRMPATKLNPLSKCFVPSAKVYELIEKSVTKNEVSCIFECQKFSKTEYCSQSRETCTMGKFICTHGHSWSTNGYYLKNDLRNLWPQTKEIMNRRTYFPCLLTCLYGMNRHATAMCPTMRLSHRPRKFTSVWSVSVEDRKLWNKYTVTEPCECPPSFGYNVPPEVLGNPLNCGTYCGESRIHMSYYGVPVHSEFDDCYSVSAPEISCTMMENLDNLLTIEESSGSEEDRAVRLDGYKKSFERFIEEICLITKAMEKLTDQKNNVVFSGMETASIQAVLKENERSETSSPGTNSVFQTASSMPPDPTAKNAVHLKDTDSQSLPKLQNISETQSRGPVCDPPCSVWCDSKQDKSKEDICEKNHKENCKSSMAIRKTRPIGNENTINDLVAQAVTLASSQKSANYPTFKETTPIFDTEQWSTWKLAEFRLRRDSGDSGYSTVSSSESHSDHEARAPFGTGDTISYGSDDLSLMGFDKDYWTPLPDCKPTSKESTIKSTSYRDWNTGADIRPSRQRKFRQRNGFLYTRDAHTASKNQKFPHTLEQQGNRWKTYEQEFPALKRCKI